MNLRRYAIGFLGLVTTTMIIFACTKDDPLEIPKNNKSNSEISVRELTDVPPDPLDANWEEGTYLVFSDKKAIKTTYENLKSLEEQEDEANAIDDAIESRTDRPLLDEWELSNNFTSMRTTYFEYEENMLEAGFAPEQFKGIPLLDNALTSMISVDGLVQVGDEIQYFSSTIYAKAPIEYKNRLRELIECESPVSPLDGARGIEITLRGDPSCKADFSLDINHSTLEVFVKYTGTPISGGDKQIVWSIDGSEHTNETSVSHDYDSAGEKTICVTYTETGIVNDTVYFYTIVTRDSTFTKKDGRDTTITIKDYVQDFFVKKVKRVICTDTYCKTFTLGGCTADFDHTIGFDNVVNFTDMSSTPYGEITGWYWTFGDGETSTERNPTHAYECDKEYTVTLIIYSEQCPGGQAVSSRKIKADGIQCCDRNPESSWKEKLHPSDNEKKIKYRYDMGTNWDWLFDQDFKAKIKYYEYRKGGIFGSKKWRKTKGTLDANFDGYVYARDEEDCTCQEPKSLTASPITKYAKTHTFKDNLSGSAFGTDKTHWMKDESPVYIDYLVNGVLYLSQHCQDSPGFHCE